MAPHVIKNAHRAMRAVLERTGPSGSPPADADLDLGKLSAEDREIVEAALPYTMTGVARLQALVDAVRYVHERRIEGAFVECGVWRGGSILAMVETLKRLSVSSRDIWLYDTFEGMTEPGTYDTSEYEPPVTDTWIAAQSSGQRAWSGLFANEIFNEDLVRRTLASTGYPEARLHFVRGAVEETLPAARPDGPIALLRLDTDWYESTRHELEHLYPALVTGGVLIIDDYGHFDGARRAVDEYLAGAGALLLNRIDYTARLAIKV